MLCMYGSEDKFRILAGRWMLRRFSLRAVIVNGTSALCEQFILLVDSHGRLSAAPWTLAPRMGLTIHVCIQFAPLSFPYYLSSLRVQFEQATAAARASLMAAQIAHHTLCSRQGGDGAGGGGGGGGSGGDIAMVPFLSNEGSLGLLVLMANMPAAIWQAQGQVRQAS